MATSSLNNDTQNDVFHHTSTRSMFIIHEQLTWVERLTIYITFIVSIIGLVGNVCTMIVLNSRSMRKWRSSILLTALAAADFLYLLIIFLSIIDTLTYQAIGLHRSLLLCQTTVYITHVCSFLSANFTLSFTLQRFVAVLFPLHANKIISTRSSTINIILLIVFSASFYSFSFFLTNISNGICKEDERYPALFPLLIVDTCLTFVLPFIVIVCFNCAIVYKLRARKQFDHRFGKFLVDIVIEFDTRDRENSDNPFVSIEQRYINCTNDRLKGDILYIHVAFSSLQSSNSTSSVIVRTDIYY
jgi:hypothetical protein